MNIGNALFGGGLGNVANVVVRTLALFLTAVAAFRIVDRRSMSGMSPLDIITIAAAGAIVGRNTVAADSSWLTASAALVTLLVAHTVIVRIRLVPGFRRFIDPPMRVLIRDGQIDAANLRRCGMTTKDLERVLRTQGHRSAEEIHLAIYEAAGEISLVPVRG